MAFHGLDNGINAFDIDLKHHPAAKWWIECVRFPFLIIMPLAQHDLRAFFSLKICKLFVRALIGNIKAKDLTPMIKALLKIRHQDLRF